MNSKDYDDPRLEARWLTEQRARAVHDRA